MSPELFDKLARYRATMAAIELMLKEGLITQDEYDQIDRIFAPHFGLDLSSIYR